MKKIKFLILALLGIILIPTTNAYELGKQNFWSDSWVPPTTAGYKGMCLHYSRDGYMTFDGKTSAYSSISSNNTSCSEGAVLGNFFAPKDYSFPWNEGIYGNNFSYVNSKKNGEGMDMIRTVYENGVHKTIIYTLPSRTAYKRTSNAGIDYMFTQIYFYHNQFILYDPVKEFGLSFLGKMNIVGGAVFSNPSLTDDNLWFVDYIHKKAYSATITNTAAWKRLLGTDVSKERLQAVNWTKSYTINPGGSSFLPPRFKIDKQGGSGYQYIEDIEFVIPERGQGNSSNQNNVAENYNKCVNYYSDIKNLAYYSQKCGEDPADEETLNRVKVDSWNAETESQTVIDQLTGANRNKCGRFAKAKKQYKEKYGAEFEKFYKEFGKYARTPEAVDIQSLCKGIELEHGSASQVNYGLFSSSGLQELFRDTKGILQNFFVGIPVGGGKFVDKNAFEKDFAIYKSYANACRDRKNLPTPYDSWASHWILGYDYITGNDNNENVCRYAEEKKQSLIKKYGNYSFDASYVASLESYLGGKVFNSSGYLFASGLDAIIANSTGVYFNSPVEKGVESLVGYFMKDYRNGYDKSFSILGYKNCGIGLGIEAWNYLVFLPVLLLFILILRGRF